MYITVFSQFGKLLFPFKLKRDYKIRDPGILYRVLVETKSRLVLVKNIWLSLLTINI